MMTVPGKILFTFIFVNQCVMFVDAQLGRRKRQERESPAAVRAAEAVGEAGAPMDKLVTHGHGHNGTTFYIFTGLLALVVSATILYSMTHFSFSFTRKKKPGSRSLDEPSVRKMEVSIDTIVESESESESENVEEIEEVSKEEEETEKSDPVSATDNSVTVDAPEDAGMEDKEPVPVSDKEIEVKDATGDVADSDVSAERATPVPSIISETIETYFPGALTGPSLAKSIESALARNGYDKDKTLLATSLCCDEVNRMLEKDIASIYGDHFSMGGLAGFAFGGITSFGAMAHHIPDGGSCVIMYGPHVGVDSEGNVGTVNRRGRAKGGACCGSAKAAAGYVKNTSAEEIVEVEPPTKALDAFTKRYLELKTTGTGRTGRATTIAAGCVKKVGPRERKELEAQTEALDAQQAFVGNMLLPFSKRLEEAEDPDVELPFSLFDAQDEFMKAIVAKGCGNVEEEGKIALLGGVQINTPGDCPEFFLPLVFEIRNNKGELVADLIRLLESA